MQSSFHSFFLVLAWSIVRIADSAYVTECTSGGLPTVLIPGFTSLAVIASSSEHLFESIDGLLYG
jgi:hypothetical protein